MNSKTLFNFFKDTTFLSFFIRTKTQLPLIIFHLICLKYLYLDIKIIPCKNVNALQA